MQVRKGEGGRVGAVVVGSVAGRVRARRVGGRTSAMRPYSCTEMKYGCVHSPYR